ncbi:ribosomal protein S18-alanine N-acetyltransferase [Peptococcaceae bacterium]|nr:ribosomal protein S18-alanine N-acetyltransferase [Peptococcaceae bacterium]
MKNTNLSTAHEDYESLKVKIQKMKPEHLPQVMEIERLSFTRPWSRRDFIHELFCNQLSCYIVALLESSWRSAEFSKNLSKQNECKVIGYAGMWLILDEAHITNLAVHPDYRNHGIGMKLMQGLLNIASENGAVRATLEVRKSNACARKLYKKLGFIEEGVRKNYYRDNKEDAIIMWKSI